MGESIKFQADERDLDALINEYNQNKFKDWNWDEKIELKLHNELTDKTITVTLEGDFITCKNCRDKILEGWYCNQKEMVGKEIIKGR
jgi:hypothetical protein